MLEFVCTDGYTCSICVDKICYIKEAINARNTEIIFISGKITVAGRMRDIACLVNTLLVLRPFLLKSSNVISFLSHIYATTCFTSYASITISIKIPKHSQMAFCYPPLYAFIRGYNAFLFYYRHTPIFVVHSFFCLVVVCYLRLYSFHQKHF